MSLPILRFSPRFVPKMWGGRELERVAHKQLPAGKPIGESWEVFDFPPGTVGPDAREPGDHPAGWTSAICTTPAFAGRSLHEILTQHSRDLLGDAKAVETSAGPQFPLLIKFLDARQDLSVQVHPPERYSKSHANAFVKNECWHILDRTPGARILVGTTPGTTRETFAKSIEDGTCESKLNAVKVEIGETFYLPSGTVHALGGGIVAAEVQTPSDTTYRVFDFNRIDPSTGKTRALHVAPALECIDFNALAVKSVNFVEAPQFVMRVETSPKSISTNGRVTAIVNVGSPLLINGETLATGETVIVPACVTTAKLESAGGVLPDRVLPDAAVRFLVATPR